MVQLPEIITLVKVEELQQERGYDRGLHQPVPREPGLRRVRALLGPPP